MLVALVAVVLLGGSPAVDAADQVARLGSPRFEEREQAAEAIKRIGRPALPALRAARSAPDLEVKTRAAALLEAVEVEALVGASPVRLDFHDRPLGEVAESIGRQADMTLVADAPPSAPRNAGPPPTWPDQRITLEAADPVSFWEAVDRLCRAGELRRPYPSGPFGIPTSWGRLTLIPGSATTPTVDSGAFRVEILRITRNRELNLTPGREEGDDCRIGGPFGAAGPGARVVPSEGDLLRTSSFVADLLVSVEPRLTIIGMSALERPEAIDDQGRSILLPLAADQQATTIRANANPGPAARAAARFAAGQHNFAPTQNFSIPLAATTEPGRRLARLGGVLAVAVMARQPDPLIVPLKSPPEVVVANEQAKVTIHETVAPPNQFAAEVELTLETVGFGGRIKVRGPGIEPIELNRASNLQLQLEFLDAEDRPLQWSFLKPPDRQGEERGRMRLCVQSREQRRVDLAAVRLVFHTMTGAAAEIPISFRDIPLP